MIVKRVICMVLLALAIGGLWRNPAAEAFVLGDSSDCGECTGSRPGLVGSGKPQKIVPEFELGTATMGSMPWDPIRKVSPSNPLESQRSLCSAKDFLQVAARNEIYAQVENGHETRGSQASTGEPDKPDGWTVGKPIVMYWGDGQPLTAARAEEAASGGYNVVWITAVPQAELAEKEGLRTILMHPLLSVDSLDSGPRQAALDALIDDYQKYPAAYAYLIADEPPLPALPGLGRLVDYIRHRDPTHLSYINVFPLPSYVEAYLPAVKPSLLSQDYYQFKSDHDSTGYLQNLQYTSQTAKDAGGIPFMNVVQAVALDDKWRVPGAGELRFLNYSTLAYGAQGIHYFLYGPTSPPASGGLIDSSGKTTAVYDALTPLNGEFVAVATELQPLNFIGAYLKGYDVGPPDIPQLPDSSPFTISSVSNTLTYAAGDPLKGVLFGFFDADGTTLDDATFVMVVNNDYTSEKTYTLSGPGDLSVFNASTGEWTATGKDEILITLPEGGGVLAALSSDVSRTNRTRASTR